VAQRRSFLLGAVAVVLVPFDFAHATPEALAEAIREVTAGKEVREGRVKLDAPPLIENGNTVPITVSVDSPMTDADYVKSIHVFNEKNPQPHVFSAVLAPRNGKAQIGTRIKLADTQKIVAIAEASDGSFWSASADIVVTTAACIEEMNN
jgi:sulfur-oxidizing protein SoxY